MRTANAKNPPVRSDATRRAEPFDDWHVPLVEAAHHQPCKRARFCRVEGIQQVRTCSHFLTFRPTPFTPSCRDDQIDLIVPARGNDVHIQNRPDLAFLVLLRLFAPCVPTLTTIQVPDPGLFRRARRRARRSRCGHHRPAKSFERLSRAHGEGKRTACPRRRIRRR